MIGKVSLDWQKKTENEINKYERQMSHTMK